MIDDKDPPIEPQDYIGGVKVVDFGDLRVARGMSRRAFATCKHKPLFYDQKERRIWCRDCESNVDAFDAFLLLVEQFHYAAADIERRREEVRKAREHNIIRIAARQMDEHFRRRNMVPACPHCHTGILPEDVGRMGSVSREWEQARRNRAGKSDV